jgi:hypothetical protein
MTSQPSVANSDSDALNSPDEWAYWAPRILFAFVIISPAAQWVHTTGALRVNGSSVGLAPLALFGITWVFIASQTRHSPKDRRSSYGKIISISATVCALSLLWAYGEAIAIFQPVVSGEGWTLGLGFFIALAATILCIIVGLTQMRGQERKKASDEPRMSGLESRKVKRASMVGVAWTAAGLIMLTSAFVWHIPFLWLPSCVLLFIGIRMLAKVGQRL